MGSQLFPQSSPEDLVQSKALPIIGPETPTGPACSLLLASRGGSAQEFSRALPKALGLRTNRGLRWAKRKRTTVRGEETSF